MARKKAAIDSFTGKYRYLGNFYPCRVDFEGESYRTAEHAFQAAKTLHPHIRKVIQAAEHPLEAKKLGNTVVLRPMWEEAKGEIMLQVLRSKFSHEDLRDLLIDTYPAHLREGNTHGDEEWGQVFRNGAWIGQNKLGILLMQLRDELRGEDD